MRQNDESWDDMLARVIREKGPAGDNTLVYYTADAFVYEGHTREGTIVRVGVNRNEETFWRNAHPNDTQ